MDCFSVKSLFEYYKHKLFIIVLLGIICLVGGYFYLKLTKIPMYKSTSTVLLINESETVKSSNNNVVLFYQDLSNVCTNLIKSSTVVDKVIDNLKLNYKFKDLINSINVETINKAELVKISVTNTNNKDASNIANELARVFKNKIEKLYDIKNIEIINYAAVSSTPYNMNITKQLIKLLLVGIVLGIGIVFAMYYFDTTLKDLEELIELDINVIGTVPTIKKTGNASLNEKLKIMCTSLLTKIEDKKIKTIMITGSDNKEGKSFIICNLGLYLSTIGYKVLIVDMSSNSQKSINIDNTKNLTFISKKIRTMKELNGISKKYDIVLFDSDSINNSSDSLSIAKEINSVVLVGVLGKTKIGSLYLAKLNIKNVNASLLGIVINRFK